MSSRCLCSQSCPILVCQYWEAMSLYFTASRGKNVRHPGSKDLRTWKVCGHLQILTLPGGRRTYCPLSGVLGTWRGTHWYAIETQKWPPCIPLRSEGLKHPWTSPYLCVWLGEECLNMEARLGALYKNDFPCFKTKLALSPKLLRGLSKISTLVTRQSLSRACSLHWEAGKCQQHNFCISLGFFFSHGQASGMASKVFRIQARDGCVIRLVGFIRC